MAKNNVFRRSLGQAGPMIRRKVRPPTIEQRLRALRGMDPAERARLIRMPVVSIQRNRELDNEA